MNLDGPRQIKGMHYNQTYTPVASWSTIWLLLVLVLSWGWKAWQLDYVLAFNQKPMEQPVFMSVPKGHAVSEGDPCNCVPETLTNTCGARQAPKQWWNFLRAKLKEASWEQSKHINTGFYNTKQNLLYALRVDNSILFGPTEEAIQQGFKELKQIWLEVTMEDKLSHFLGVHVEELQMVLSISTLSSADENHQRLGTIIRMHIQEGTPTRSQRFSNETPQDWIMMTPFTTEV